MRPSTCFGIFVSIPVLALLAACGGGQGTTANPPVTVTATATATVTVSSSPTPDAPEASETPTVEPSTAPAPEGAVEGTFAFGDSVENAELGTTLTVSKPSDFPLSDSAYCEGDGKPQAWKVTLENNGSDKVEVSQVFISVQSGDTEASQCFDSAQGIDSAPSTALLPGRKVSWDIVFKVVDPKDLVMEVNQDWTSDPVYFVN